MRRRGGGRQRELEGGRKKVRAVMVGVAYSDGRSRGDELMRERI